MSEDVRRMLGENVRKLRLASGISQAKLAERMGVDRAYISGLEKGERNPTVLTVWHLSRALEVAMRDFFEEKAKSKRER